MLQQEGARVKGITVATVFSDMVDWNNKSCNRLGYKNNVFDCCNTVLRYGGWNDESVATGSIKI